MKTTLTYLITWALFALLVWQSAITASTLVRIGCVVGAAFIAFLAGIGVGERSNASFTRRLTDANRLQEDELEELRASNAKLREQNRETTKSRVVAQQGRDDGTKL